jgi:hypothetical protein
MTESLREMLDESVETIEAVAQEIIEAVSDETVETVVASGIATLSMPDWVEKHKDKLTALGISRIGLRSERVDMNSDMIFMSTVQVGEESKSELYMVKDAKNVKILDIEPESFSFYKNDLFQVIQNASEDIVLKSYVSKNSLITVSCIKLENEGSIYLLPVGSLRKNKKHDNMEIPEMKAEHITEKLSAPADIETVLVHKYDQISKTDTVFTTNSDIALWMIKRQIAAIDINHQMRIDKILISLIND